MSNECLICYSEFETTKFTHCPGCNFQCCKNCLKTCIQTSKKANCPNHGCGLKFTRKFIFDNLGKTFYTNVVRKFEEDVIFHEQKLLLPQTQPLVQWEREYRKQKDLVRFGKRINIGARPKIENETLTFFPCPVKECRGFIEPQDGFQTNCRICSNSVCLKCREVISENHECNPETLANIVLILQTTKPCPTCGAGIHKTEGCNHMFCTHCRTHFHWVSGKVLRVSTNGHYNHLPEYAQNLTRRDAGVHDSNEEQQQNNTRRQQERCLVPDDSVDRANVEELMGNILFRTMYHDLDVVRTALRGKYHILNAYQMYEESLLDLRIEFLLEDITEARWKSRMYSITKQYERDQHITNILSVYAQTIVQFQTIFMNCIFEGIPFDNVNVSNWIDCVNQSLQSLHEEFGGNLVKIRNLNDTNDVPPLLM